MRWRISALAREPSMMVAGSPGMRWISEKTSVATPSSTRTVSAGWNAIEPGRAPPPEARARRKPATPAMRTAATFRSGDSAPRGAKERTFVRRRVSVASAAVVRASKAGVILLTQSAALELGPLGIRVNAIAPGEIDTTILSPGTSEIVAHQIPMHRLGTPDEVAKIIYVLCTDTSSYVNGAEIHINGGQHV